MIFKPCSWNHTQSALTKKQKEKKELETINKAPSVKDLDIQRRLDNISKFNLGIEDDNDNNDDDDDNNDNDGGNSRLSFQGTPPIFPPTPPVTPSTSALSPTQRFVLDNGNEKPTQAIALDRSSTPVTKRITFSDTITKIFPKTRKLDTINEDSVLDFENDETDIQNIEDESDISSVIGGLKDGNLPIDLEFFCGGEKNKQKLIENATKNIGVLNELNKKFINYLTSKYGDFVLTKNKIKIQLESSIFCKIGCQSQICTCLH